MRAGVTLRLTRDPGQDESPSWSPDGTTIAYDSSGSTPLDDDGLSPTQEIWSVPSEGGTPRQLTRNEVPDQTPTYSPDGRRIAFAHDVTISVIDASGGNLSSVSPVRTVAGWAPAWSPDGRMIAYLVFTGSHGDVPDPTRSGHQYLALGSVKTVDVRSGQIGWLGQHVPTSRNPVSWLPSSDGVLVERFTGAVS